MPPPSPVPPSPMPPSPPAVAAGVERVTEYTVSSSAVLAGVRAAAFGQSEQLAFASAVAASVGAPAPSTFVDSVVDTAGRRRLLVAGADVAFSIVTEDASATTGLASGISVMASDAASFTSALNAAFAAIPGGSSIPVLSAADLTVSQPVVAAVEVSTVTLSKVANVSAATAAVSALFSNMSVAAAGAQQQSFLTRLASGTADAPMSASTASTAVSLVFAVVTAANVQMSDASQTAALDILSKAAGTTQLANSSVAQDVVSVLALVASSAVLSPSGTGQSRNALQAVAGVVDTLTGSQATALSNALSSLPPGALPPEPSVTSTPSIQTRVQVDPPGSSRLTSSPLTVPGSPSSFDAMPAGLLPAVSPVVTTFVSLAFGACPRDRYCALRACADLRVPSILPRQTPMPAAAAMAAPRWLRPG
jgi:hypothetical protein